MMWKQPRSRSRTGRSSSRDPGHAEPPIEAAAVPGVVLPGADPEAGLPIEAKIISTRGGRRDANADEHPYHVVMSCHVEIDPPPLARTESVGAIGEWILSARRRKGDLEDRS